MRVASNPSFANTCQCFMRVLMVEILFNQLKTLIATLLFLN